MKSSVPLECREVFFPPHSKDIAANCYRGEYIRNRRAAASNASSRAFDKSNPTLECHWKKNIILKFCLTQFQMMPEKCFGILFLILIGVWSGALGAFVGVNIGTEISSPPRPQDVVNILKANKITHVRLFDASPALLNALRNTKIDVIVGVTNGEVLKIGESQPAAAQWISQNISPYIQLTRITAIAVGSEILTSVPTASSVLVPAMMNLHFALVASNLNQQVKVSTPHPMQIIPRPFPPSAATFNSTWNTTMYQILRFLKNTNSSFMLNAYPYYGYAQGKGIYPIDYVLFQPLPPSKQIVDPNTLFHYDSMFEAMVDAAYYSMRALGFTAIPVLVTETGWPSIGGSNEPDATVENAAAFNNNLTLRVLNGTGPPSHLDIPLNCYIYELFNEDDKVGPVSEKNWGAFFSNGSNVYPMSFNASGHGNGNLSEGFCVAKSSADEDGLRRGLNWACGLGKANCNAIQPGKPCYLPNTVRDHASFAYNDYYKKQHHVGGTCDFDSTAVLVSRDPSHGSCIYTGSFRSNTTSFGMSPPAASGPVDVFAEASGPRVSKTGFLLMAMSIALVFF